MIFAFVFKIKPISQEWLPTPIPRIDEPVGLRTGSGLLGTFSQISDTRRKLGCFIPDKSLSRPNSDTGRPTSRPYGGQGFGLL